MAQTHAHDDHVGGAAKIIKDCDVKNACFTHGLEIRDSGKGKIKQFLSKKVLKLNLT
ncbi:MAG: hypothetical protein ACKO8C_03925 [Candidatus Nanopelagicaceae bacterium]